MTTPYCSCTVPPQSKRCHWAHELLGRCPNPATAQFVRVSHTNEHAPLGQVTWVCDEHLMGDGEDGRRDWGWRRLA
jgi:hypothetical protein